jgi:hypothetical protein
VSAPGSGGAGLLELEPAHRALALFAHALAGRPLRLVPRGHAVTRAHLPPPEPAADAVPVPRQVEGFADASRRRGALRIAVLREVIRAGPDGSSERGMARRADGPRPVLLRRVQATLERMRIDVVLAERFPGARADLARVRAATAARIATSARGGRARALLRDLAAASLDASPSRDPDPSGLRAPLLQEVAALRDGPVTADDCRAAAARIVALFAGPWSARPRAAGRDGAVPAPGRTPDEPPAPAATGRSPAHGAHPGAPGRRRGGDAASAATSAAGGHPGGVPAAPRARPAPPDPAPAAGADRGSRAPTDAGGVLHDEWDYRAQRYLRAWCRVHEQRLRGTDVAFIDGVRARHGALRRRILERLARLPPARRSRERRLADGDEIDLEALVEAVAERRGGRTPTDRLYEQRTAGARDVAAAFLVDLSASTAATLAGPDADAGTAAPADASASADAGALLYGLYDDAPEPEPAGPRRRVIDVARDALALMVEALGALGDAHAVYGFSGEGRDHVEFVVAKDFADPVSASTWAALAAMQPRRSTRMGAAIRHAAARLARQPAGRRLLILVSDGYPQDIDYGPDRRDEAYGVHDTARALRDAERAGLATFCLTVDRAGHDYLRRMCAPRRYLVIDEVAALPAALAQVYAELRSAA